MEAILLLYNSGNSTEAEVPPYQSFSLPLPIKQDVGESPSCTQVHFREKVREGDAQWDTWLPEVLTGFPPFELMFGREARSPVKALRETMTRELTAPKLIVAYLTDLVHKMEVAQETVEQTY